MRLGLHQLAQSGATDQQVPVWDDASDVWIPGDVSGGGGTSDDLLTPSSLNATYGDHFTGSSLDAKWTRVTYASGDETYQAGGGSWLQTAARTTGAYYYQA